MKTLILLFTAVSITTLLLPAQNISDNAIGLRLGASDGFGTEISYQRAISDNNRLEANLGWKNGNDFSGFRLAALYQWVWQLDGNFNWYAGAGGGLANYDFDDHSDHTFLFAAGNIGIEHNFNIPIVLSLDFRPEIGFGNAEDNLDFDIAFGIRYQF